MRQHNEEFSPFKNDFFEPFLASSIQTTVESLIGFSSSKWGELLGEEVCSERLIHTAVTVGDDQQWSGDSIAADFTFPGTTSIVNIALILSNLVQNHGKIKNQTTGNFVFPYYLPPCRAIQRN